VPGHAPGRLDHLAHAVTRTAAKVVGQTVPISQGLQRHHVGARQIQHVDVVPDAGAIRRRVVRTEDLDGGSLALGHFQHQGDEVCLGGMVFPQLRAAPRRVEIPQGCDTQAQQTVHPLQGTFHQELGIAVRIGGDLGVFLIDGGVFGIPVGGGSAREEELLHPVGGEAVQEHHGPRGIVHEEPARIDHALPGLGVGSEVHHRFEGCLDEELIQQAPIAEVPLEEGGSRMDSLPMPLLQAVQDRDRMPLLDQQSHHMTADVPGSSGHKNMHGHLCSL